MQKGINPYQNLPPEQRATQHLVDQFNADERLWKKLEPRRRLRRKMRPKLSAEELEGIRSQPVIASIQSQIVTASKRNIRYRPWAFTEHGALMAATVLNSPRAVAMSLYVIRAFVKMREDLAANAAILKRLAEIDKTLLVHDSALRDIYQKLRPLLDPPPPPPKPEIGFHVKEGAVPYRTARKERHAAAQKDVGQVLCAMAP